VETGALKLAGTDRARIVGLAEELLKDGELFKGMTAAKNPFGDGRAAERTVAALAHWFGLEAERPADFGQ
jgi:UDP-N-acetylglucosamine 2-epimerase